MKKVFVGLLAVLMLFQFVSAVDTNVKVVTYANHNISLIFLNTNSSTSSSILERVNLNSGETGEVSTVFSTEVESFNVGATLFNGDEQVLYEMVKDLNTGDDFLLRLFPNNVEVEIGYVDYSEEVVEEDSNESVLTGNVVEEDEEADSEAVVEDEEVVEEETESVVEDSGKKINFFGFLKVFQISGFATSEGGSKKIIYGGTIFILLGIIAIFVFVRKRRQANQNGFSRANSDYGKDFLDRRIDEVKDE